ncbi:MAG: hypothetical protein KatS3mg105_4811 [Gemmatales bacterium]|nr:MAG: hypothetical protein KatS3mg105_4811 [Gemmatales bacterium]
MISCKKQQPFSRPISRRALPPTTRFGSMARGWITACPTSSRSMARPICRGNSKLVWPCRKTIASMFTRRTWAFLAIAEDGNIVGFQCAGRWRIRANAWKFQYVSAPGQTDLLRPSQSGGQHFRSRRQAVPRPREPGRSQASAHQIRGSPLGRRKIPQSSCRLCGRRFVAAERSRCNRFRQSSWLAAARRWKVVLRRLRRKWPHQR